MAEKEEKTCWNCRNQIICKAYSQIREGIEKVPLKEGIEKVSCSIDHSSLHNLFKDVLHSVAIRCKVFSIDD